MIYDLYKKGFVSLMQRKYKAFYYAINFINDL